MTPEETRALEESWQRIGLLLALLQSVEHGLAACLRWVYVDDPFGDADPRNAIIQFERLSAEEKKQTLGRMLRHLRTKADIESDSLDMLLQRFLEDRNRFVHRLFTEAGFGINNPQDVVRVRAFVDDLTQRAVILLRTFGLVLQAWAKENGLDEDAPKKPNEGSGDAQQGRR